MNNKLFLILILFGLLGWGCLKPYPQFYHDETNGFDVTTSPLYEIPDGEPKVINSNFANIENDDITMFEDGYIRLGYSSFNAKHYGEHEEGNSATYQALCKNMKTFPLFLFIFPPFPKGFHR